MMVYIICLKRKKYFDVMPYINVANKWVDLINEIKEGTHNIQPIILLTDVVED